MKPPNFHANTCELLCVLRAVRPGKCIQRLDKRGGRGAVAPPGFEDLVFTRELAPPEFWKLLWAAPYRKKSLSRHWYRSSSRSTLLGWSRRPRPTSSFCRIFMKLGWNDQLIGWSFSQFHWDWAKIVDILLKWVKIQGAAFIRKIAFRFLSHRR